MRTVRTLFTLLLFFFAAVSWAEPLTFEQLASMRTAGGVVISPDGEWIAYTLSVPRDLKSEEDGGAWAELRVVPTQGGDSLPYVQGQVNVSAVQFSPDSKHIFYLSKGEKHSAVFAIPVGGGGPRKMFEHSSDVVSYSISPDGKQLAFIAVPAESKERKAAKKKGFTEEVFEEDWRPRQLYIAPVPAFDGRAQAGEPAAPRQVEVAGSAFSVEWFQDGKRLLTTLAPRPLVDDSYMKKRIRVLDAKSGEILARLDNPGKLGAVHASPDGKWIAAISAADPNDPSAGRLIMGLAAGGALRDVMPGLEAHVSSIAWQDAEHVMAVVAKNTETLLVKVHRSGKQKLLAESGGSAPIMASLTLSRDGQHAAMAGHSPSHPTEVFAMNHGEQGPRRITDSNPWLADVSLAKQEVIRHSARDGLELEGVLIRPLDNRLGTPAPLMLIVHGGPESHVYNGWNTNYSRLGQLAAGQGYAVFYPNYRGSTGRGVAFSKTSQGDAAGKEFDDLIDAVDHLIAEGIVDTDRVGITGGSYGGYATAWCSTRYTERFKAGVMFVGISNKLSKGFTTDIPVEDKMVHTLFDPWTKWQFALDRSPLYHAEKSRTALLIGVGKEDPRVHPSQSLQMYRALKLIDKTPVRLVRYPGEGHGNRRAASRDDYGRRLLRWFNHFVLTDSKELPPWEIEHPVLDAADDKADEEE